MAAATTLTAAWRRRGLLAWLLAPLALLYGSVLALRRAAYATGVARSTRLPVPVVVIGNLYVGGTGKTPLTIELVRALRARGWTPGVVSRGYGRAANDVRIVAATDDAANVGDEPLLIAQASGAPVAVGADRVQAARHLLERHPDCDVIIADDGLQHLRLARDVQIAVVDERGVGNGWVLPAGPLREPVRALARVDALVLHGTAADPLDNERPGDRPKRFHMRSRLAAHLESLAQPGQALALTDLVQRQKRDPALTVLAAAGIGVPQRFFAMLQAAGLAIEELPLPDHHDFADDPFAGSRAAAIVITAKDAVKCRRNAALRSDARIWIAPLIADIDGDLADLVAARLTSPGHSPHGPSPA